MRKVWRGRSAILCGDVRCGREMTGTLLPWTLATNEGAFVANLIVDDEEVR